MIAVLEQKIGRPRQLVIGETPRQAKAIDKQ
jgi:citrate synthase